ncbi:hypothetical protein FA09DRAFT_223623 [Tilletiopsis washingtonensis]|jgi:hypothetical protein|uniref:Uncharacterized protein n=1 Tax=Tilletiopsis washingtonensis TaxID=58919 RepID=A0A316ZFW6_9BASI|nr:hypothetical protein FA09DRAFT_223623 [Tilletiopsis washingtonensis]PWN99245.1 hypothetical protein FA09DRAFT_223623 [Tilletiopsis washingtonensis]
MPRRGARARCAMRHAWTSGSLSAALDCLRPSVLRTHSTADRRPDGATEASGDALAQRRPASRAFQRSLGRARSTVEIPTLLLLGGCGPPPVFIAPTHAIKRLLVASLPALRMAAAWRRSLQMQHLRHALSRIGSQPQLATVESGPPSHTAKHYSRSSSMQWATQRNEGCCRRCLLCCAIRCWVVSTGSPVRYREKGA